MAMDINFTGTSNTLTDNMGTRQLTESKAQVAEEKTKVAELVKSDQQAKDYVDKESNNQELAEVTDDLNDMASIMRKGLAFKVDDDSGKNVISVMDIDSGDVIRQIPNEEALELSKKLAEVAGILLSTEA
ncbi:flagellar protein FlaG [Shewanella sp. P1-14-1]|uniref:flagellar protein FlaG n=1 Tax=Shewanella sp. P1-14-1 TaxID=1723761 RepID=UPI0006D67259|nr:flagellar protein FlaG [Shewanella sp. P1-14-1]KPZ69916.1 flagellar protein FlaG [Shewanella sp. P1-14-1]